MSSRPRFTHCAGWKEPRHATARAIGVLVLAADNSELPLCPVCLVDFVRDESVCAEDRANGSMVVGMLEVWEAPNFRPTRVGQLQAVSGASRPPNR